jgi:hypothetical protein
MKRLILPVALLFTTCPGDRAEKSEAAAIDRAIDALRDAPNETKSGALSALKALPCSVPEICGAQSACVAGYELHVSGIAELERAKQLAAEGDGGAELATLLESSRATLERAKPLTDRCTDLQGELARKYRL